MFLGVRSWFRAYFYAFEREAVKSFAFTGTIEDKILQLQEQKRGVVDAALGQGGERQTESNKLTAEDLTFLFS